MRNEAQKKYEQLLTATEQYYSAPITPYQSSAPTIWRKGNARLLDYGVGMQADAKAYTLLVPSLINRHYILDLSKRRSFIQYMRGQGIYPLVLDWNEPGEEEAGFDMADYVRHLLLPAITFVSNTTAAPVHLLGYCLGGVLALAAAQLAPTQVQSLSLLATPWNFASEDTAPPMLDEHQLAFVEQQLASSPTLHPMLLQWLFMLRQPFAFEKKFLKMTDIRSQSELEDFVLIERWANDNVPMASGAAIDCLIHWAQKNELYMKKWKVRGQCIDPKKVKQPCFVAIPNQDTIVPSGCAMALANALPDAHICTPNAGHVGMVVGRKAKAELWQAYADFTLDVTR